MTFILLSLSIVTKKKVILALLVCFFVAVLAQSPPPKPDWPAAWSATVMVERSDDVIPHFYRWFWDMSQNKDRLDGLVKFRDEFYFAELIFDHTAKKAYEIFYQDDVVNCFSKPLNTTLPKPNFGGLIFRGNAMINFIPAYHWSFNNQINGHHYQVYDRQDSRELLRIDFDDTRKRRQETWNFFEFDVGLQDPTLFKIPDPIMAICNDF